MSIRPATAADVDAVAALELELFGADAWSRTSVAEELSGPRRIALVAVAEDGPVLGYAVALLGDDVLDLARIAVATAHRRAGVARALLRDVRRAGLARGAQGILLEVSSVNEAALGFYAAQGFERIDRRPRYYRDGADALVLRGILAGTSSDACGGRP